jgi:hypothetical protein
MMKTARQRLSSSLLLPECRGASRKHEQWMQHGKDLHGKVEPLPPQPYEPYQFQSASCSPFDPARLQLAQ